MRPEPLGCCHQLRLLSVSDLYISLSGKSHRCRVKEDSTGMPSRMDQDKRILAEESLVLRSNSGSAGLPNCFPDFSQQFCTTYEAGYHMMPHTFQTSSRTPFFFPPCLRIADGVLES